jgi:hypothetical protein
MDFWDRIILFALIAAVLTPVYWLLRFCIRVGAKRAVRDIIHGFRQEVAENKGGDILDDEVKLKRVAKEHSGWYPLADGSRAQFEITDIGRMLGRIGYSSGENWASERLPPKDDEAEARMKRASLERIVWLADIGLRVYTHPGFENMRGGERFNKQDAEQTASLLDDFERKIAVGWPNETDEDKEQRCSHHWNRQTDLFRLYP